MKHIKTYEKKSKEDIIIELQILEMIDAFLIFYRNEFTKLGFKIDELEPDHFGDNETFVAEVHLASSSPIYVEWNRKKLKMEVVLYNGGSIKEIVIKVQEILKKFGKKKKSDRDYMKNFNIPIENIPNITKEIELINIANNYNL